MSPPSYAQQAAIKRLEALFSNVSLDHRAKPKMVRIETKVDRCCEVHGNRYKENCAFRRNRTPSPTIVTTTYTPTLRRGSLNVPPSPIKKEAHPSTFASSLRKDPLGSSVSSINTQHKIPNGTSSSSSRRGSTSSLKKTDLHRATSPPRRDYVAKSSSPQLSSTAKIRERLKSTGELSNRSSSVKSVAFKVGSLSSLTKDTRLSSSLYGSRKFSADSLENLHKRHSWDPARRGSSGSSGGWDDPIWEENDYGTCVDEVRFTSVDNRLTR